MFHVISKLAIFEILDRHRQFHHDDVIRIYVNVSETTYTTYQQLEIYIQPVSKVSYSHFETFTEKMTSC